MSELQDSDLLASRRRDSLAAVLESRDMWRPRHRPRRPLLVSVRDAKVPHPQAGSIAFGSALEMVELPRHGCLNKSAKVSTARAEAIHKTWNSS